MLHNCIYNEDGVCKWCGCFRGLNKAESEEYLKGLVGGCFSTDEGIWWGLHEKHLRSR